MYRFRKLFTHANANDMYNTFKNIRYPEVVNNSGDLIISLVRKMIEYDFNKRISFDDLKNEIRIIANNNQPQQLIPQHPQPQMSQTQLIPQHPQPQMSQTQLIPQIQPLQLQNCQTSPPNNSQQTETIYPSQTIIQSHTLYPYQQTQPPQPQQAPPPIPLPQPQNQQINIVKFYSGEEKYDGKYINYYINCEPEELSGKDLDTFEILLPSSKSNNIRFEKRDLEIFKKNERCVKNYMKMKDIIIKMNGFDPNTHRENECFQYNNKRGNLILKQMKISVSEILDDVSILNNIDKYIDKLGFEVSLPNMSSSSDYKSPITELDISYINIPKKRENTYNEQIENEGGINEHQIQDENYTETEDHTENDSDIKEDEIQGEDDIKKEDEMENEEDVENGEFHPPKSDVNPNQCCTFM